MTTTIYSQDEAGSRLPSSPVPREACQGVCDTEVRNFKAQISPERSGGDIVGQSRALKAVLRDVGIVAATSSTVLIEGETGTGKELIAQTIHNLSPRRHRNFSKINCAAIPSGLLESELFGHEKGAFTGAVMRKIGRFELAHEGTLFLDEIADIPLELQPKMLRVLQEQEFERLGGTQTIRVNVRLVAATSRELPQMITDRQFRGDLYYRLNVFPIRVPPLRERIEDIPMLVRHFMDKYAREMNRPVETIPPQVMEQLSRYHWPGNIRELQNVIERAVILSPDKVLRDPLAELQRPAERSFAVTTGVSAKPTTLADCERDHSLQTLNQTRWIVGGPKGAAARLGLKRTTLIWKMQKLGIARKMAAD